jgi:hypothetical protein
MRGDTESAIRAPYSQSNWTSEKKLALFIWPQPPALPAFLIAHHFKRV